MEIVVESKEDKKLIFELRGAGHTFCNNLKKELYEDSNVDISAYNVNHPLIGIPKVIVQSKKKTSFKKELQGAAKRTKKNNDDFRKAFKKAK